MMSFMPYGYSKLTKKGFVEGYFEPYFTNEPVCNVTRRQCVLQAPQGVPYGPPVTLNFRTIDAGDGKYLLDVDLLTASMKFLAEKPQSQDERIPYPVPFETF